ncbi:MAG TPA: prolyl oligopeptidase family serine peptidase [Steroidobacteraceae bacterium]|nr:prolyl oligopeptidase family serine peptidase [Steroidobacteraceae bacterium]
MTLARALFLTPCLVIPMTPRLLADPIKYPETATVEQRDVFEVAIDDPYRWLEQDVRESPEVADWVARQNAVTMKYLHALPGRAEIERRVTELWDYERFSLPVKRGGRYFFLRNDGLQNQAVLYVQDSLDAVPRLLIDPNGWSEDGTTALADFEPSPDGRFVAYAVQESGSDWRRIEVLDVASGERVGEPVQWAKFTSIAWAGDGSGFFYARFPEPEEGAAYQNLNLNHAVYFHRIGAAQSQDRLVYSRPQFPEHSFSVRVTDDGRYLLITVWKGTDERYELVVDDLSDDAPPTLLIGGFEHEYALAGNVGRTFYLRTNRGAPRSRIVAVELDDPDPARWREIVPQADATLVGANLVGTRLVANYLEHASTAVRLYTLDGQPAGRVELPGLGTASGFDGRADDPETFFAFASFNVPTTLYRFDVLSDEREVFKRPPVPFDPADYVVEQVFYESRDGTRVPMFISHRRDIERDGRTPTLLYGYGGFNQSITPYYSVQMMAWMQMGGILAVANLRGGGEYGKAWHDAGRLANKQNVFDDFIAAAEFLIEQRYTSPQHLGIQGGSNGGLLVAAVINQRPDLFAAALPAVGVMDMLRFNRFTAGRFWVDDYGDPGNPQDLQTLLAYSPYHNIRRGIRYPAVLVTTADTDDRVVPAHSFKYIARLQQAQGGEAPVLIRIETRAGHGAGIPTSKRIEEVADSWAFLAYHTGREVPAQRSALDAGR